MYLLLKSVSARVEKEVYRGARGYAGGNNEAIQRAIRIKIVLETGWPFEYIDELNLTDYEDMLAYFSGQSKADEANSS